MSTNMAAGEKKQEKKSKQKKTWPLKTKAKCELKSK